jgi:hypothetical protein
MSHYTTLQKLMSSFDLGLFFNLSANDSKLPNGIGRLLDVDEHGCCWFLFHFPPEEAVYFEQEFPARFRLYEKGRDCYIEISGLAERLSDMDEWAKCAKISYGMAKALRYHGLVLRMKFTRAVVYELTRHSKRNRIQRMLDGLDEWVTGKSIHETVYQAATSTQ